MTSAWKSPDVAGLSQAIVGRSESFLAPAMAERDSALRDLFAGRRVLVLGGAGFIATQTVRQVLRYGPAYLGLVDISENGLAEIVRDLRSSAALPPGVRLEPWLADIGTPLFHRVLDAAGTPDVVMNFAAVKHVRTERDVPSLLRMLQVNVLAVHDATALVRQRNPQCRQFVVSTDKAADPVSFMGASKRWMELAALAADPSMRSARFANVAFSSGSLLESWLRRVGRRQPVSVPADTWRFLITPEESGQLCSLAATAAPARISIPGQLRLTELQAALETVLTTLGLRPRAVPDVEAGFELLRSAGAGREGLYPVVVTDRDTAGEKRAEQFLGAGQSPQPWLPGLDLVTMSAPVADLVDVIGQLRTMVSDPASAAGLPDLERLVASCVPEFHHLRAAQRLDDRV